MLMVYLKTKVIIFVMWVYANLVSLAKGLMLNSVLEEHIIWYCFNCRVAALIANRTCKVLPDYFNNLIIQICFVQKSPKRPECIRNPIICGMQAHKLLKAGQLCLEVCIKIPELSLASN